MPIIEVGVGRTYATRQIAWDTLSGADQGGTVTASLFGDDTSTFTASGASVNPWVFEDSATTYDFTASTEDLLARLNSTVIQSENVTFKNVLFYSSNAFVVTLTISADNVVIENYRLISGASANGRSITTVQANTFVRNGVESGGVDVSTTGFGDGCNVNNLIKFGGSDKGAEGAGSVGVHFITDTFSFGNVGVDLEASVFTISTSATEDSSGAALTGYTSAELVDFAGRDYRTKGTSFLATAGTGGSFIGAALEASGSGLTLTADNGAFSTTFQPATLTYSSLTSYAITTDSGSFATTGQAVDLLFNRKIPVDSGDYSTTFNNASLLFNRALSAGSASYTTNFQDATLVYATAGQYTLVANSGSFNTSGTDLALLYDRALPVDDGAFNTTLNDASLSIGRRIQALSGDYVTTGQDISYLYNRVIMAESGDFITTGYNVTLSYSGQPSQTIGTVTAGFKQDIYTAGYKPNSITVSFKE